VEYYTERTWIEIDLDVIKKNYLEIKRKLQHGCNILAVVKANAYGLGSVKVAQLFQEIHCPIVAVATIQEAMELRENNITLPILILGPINPKHVSLAIENELQISIISYKNAQEITEASLAAGKSISAHIKIDSGLSRLGIVVKNRKNDALKEIDAILSLGGIHVAGVFTHTSNLSAGENDDLEKSELELFSEIVAYMKKNNPEIKAHCLSSSTLQHYPEYSFDFVRIGILYMGIKPDASSIFNISQAVSLKSRILQVKQLAKGASISYNATFVTTRPTTIAIIPIGYADGLRRSLSNRGHVLVRGEKAPIVGKICCDYTILDVTDIPHVAEGDIATIFGRDNGKEQYAYHYADLYPASISEVTATITSRIPRYYRKDNKLSDKSSLFI